MLGFTFGYVLVQPSTVYIHASHSFRIILGFQLHPEQFFKDNLGTKQRESNAEISKTTIRTLTTVGRQASS